MIKPPFYIYFIFKKMPLIYQLMRFGLVGVLASAVHFLVVVLLVQYGGFQPLLANVVGFATGFQVSYAGHRRFTFRGTTALHQVAYSRLMLLQLNNFILNETLFYFLLSRHFSYQAALLIVLSVLPIMTFTVSKFWVFR